MSPAQAASALGKLGAARRRQNDREPILARARQMLADMGRAPDPRLSPPLLLTQADRL